MQNAVEIYVLGKRVRLLQAEGGFRTSLDSVILAAACPVKGKNRRILDMGCGVGGAAFCVLKRVPDCHVTGVDIDPASVDLADSNIVLNEMDGRADFICSDIKKYEPADGRRFDHIICNPPFLEAGTYTPSPDQGRAIALGHEGQADMDLSEWVDAGFRLLKSGGSLTMIHRADMTDKIIQAMGVRFGAVEIIPLWPRAGQAAKRVVIRAVKDRKSPSILNPGIILHEANGSYTEEADNILRNMSAI